MEAQNIHKPEPELKRIPFVDLVVYDELFLRCGAIVVLPKTHEEFLRLVCKDDSRGMKFYVFPVYYYIEGYGGTWSYPVLFASSLRKDIIIAKRDGVDENGMAKWVSTGRHRRASGTAVETYRSSRNTYDFIMSNLGRKIKVSKVNVYNAFYVDEQGEAYSCKATVGVYDWTDAEVPEYDKDELLRMAAVWRSSVAKKGVAGSACVSFAVIDFRRTGGLSCIFLKKNAFWVLQV